MIEKKYLNYLKKQEKREKERGIMKQLLFKENGVIAIKNLGNQGDGCCIQIKDSLLDEAIQSGIVNETTDGKGEDNKYFRIGDITLVRIKPEIYTIIDSYINDNKEWVAETLKNYSIIYQYSKRKGSKHTVRICIPNVIHTNRKGETIKSSWYININTVIHELSNQNLKLGENYVYSSSEGHHDLYCWDNRVKNTKVLSMQAHNEYHKKISGASHQVIVNIQNNNQLINFIDFVNQGYAV